MTRPLRVGTRSSPLALAQTAEALALLRSAHADVAFETVPIRTQGDEGYRDDLGTPVDGKRAFTRRIDDALLDGSIDFAVHSLKDVPTDLAPGLEIAAVPARGDPRDVLLANDGLSLGRMPEGARIGTGSLRRKAQLLSEWPRLEVVDLHGNVGTRLRRLDAKDFDGLVLAAAGLERLGVGDRRPEPIDPDFVTPAPGQGALALECRSKDGETRGLLRSVEDPSARVATDAERALSSRIGGACNVPFGALATVEAGSLVLRGVVASPDGRRIVRARVQGPVDGGPQAVETVASKLLQEGAAEILSEVTG